MTLSPRWRAIVLITTGVLAVNVVYLTGLGSANPLFWTSNFSQQQCLLACGQPSIDPNAGFLTQPLGWLAAHTWLHGHVPWWNHLQGLGQPLAGGMQSAALFPFVLLFVLPSGFLLFHIVLQVLAGVATYLLLRRFVRHDGVALVAGLLMAMNGTMSWLQNAVENPVAFLPVLLLGLELLSKPASRVRGWWVSALAVSLSLYAGFPEVAFLNTLFAGGWALARLGASPRGERLANLLRAGTAVALGILLAFPVLIPFVDYLKVAYVGAHGSGALGMQALPAQGLSMFLSPYAYGVINASPSVATTWAGIGGYFGGAVVVLALCGVVGTTLRSLRFYLAGWVVVALAGVFNLVHVRALWNLIPGMSRVSFSRYVMASCIFAVIVLATLALDAAPPAERRSDRVLRRIGLVVGALGLLATFVASSATAHETYRGIRRVELVGLRLAPLLAIAIVLAATRFADGRKRSVLMGGALLLEAMIYFIVPTSAAQRHVVADEPAIAYLQAHQGDGRLLSLGPLHPNWGSQWGIRSLSAIDLPFPKRFAHYIDTELYPGLRPLNQFLTQTGNEYTRRGLNMLETHLSAYRDAAVAYVALPPAFPVDATFVRRGFQLVYRDDLVSLYRTPGAVRYARSPSGACSIAIIDVDHLVARCARRATIVRSELAMPGWSVSVNGTTTPIRTWHDTYQSVVVPEGRSSVTFRYTPPHETLAIIVALGALGALGALTVQRRRPRIRRGAAGSKVSA